MRVVLDSSVLIAAWVSRAGVCAHLYEDVVEHHDLYVSTWILEEFSRNLRRKLLLPDRLVRAATQALERASTLVVPAEIPAGDCRDPHDLPILGTAAAAHAHALVTVDDDLLSLGRHRETVIVRPAAFWKLAPPPTRPAR